MRSAAIKPDSETLATLRALRRAARNAWRLAKETGTPFYVMKGGRVVDLNQPRKRKRSPR